MDLTGTRTAMVSCGRAYTLTTCNVHYVRVNKSEMSTKRADLNVEEQSKPGKKKRKTETVIPVEVNPTYDEQSFKAAFGTAFRNQEFYENGIGASVFNEPFTCSVLPDFLRDDDFLQGLKDELLNLPFNVKSNDLYQFQQSDALQNFSSPHISGLRKFLYEDFLSWLKDVTGIDMDKTVDMTCSKYNYTDTLLCHDDELGDRRIAYILYLVPPWNMEDGGALDLFKVDENGQPSDVTRSLLPKWNNFVFFEVTPVSFHQVAEVLSQDKCRLSVSGWFHGLPVDRPTPFIEPQKPLQSYCSMQDDEFFSWVDPSYLDVIYQSEIQDSFSDDSEIQLPNFFKEDKYEAVSKALESADIRWQRVGPSNKRNYERAVVTTLSQIVQDCLDVLQSEHMFLTLSNFTGLKLHQNAADNESSSDSEEETEDKSNEETKDETSKETECVTAKGSSESEGVVIVNKSPVSNPRCRAEVRKWTHGCYTLMHDTDTEGSEYALDAVIHFNRPSGWHIEHAGYTTYIAKAEDEELLTVNPCNNALSLIYRDKETLRFVKYLNHRFNEFQNNGGAAMYDIQLVYYE